MKLDKYIVKQKDLTDCGAACLLMLIKYYKGNNTIDAIRNLSGTSLEGTTLLGLHQAANKLGFDAQGCRADLQSLKEHGKPLILHIKTSALDHFVVLFAYKSKTNEFIIGDPELGLETYTEEKLLEKWQSKICLVVDKKEAFDTINTVDESMKHKLKWLYSLLKKDTDLLIISALLGIIIAITGLGTSIFSQYMIDEILPTGGQRQLLYAIGLLGLVVISSAILTYLRGILLFKQRRDFNIRVNNYFLKNLLQLPLSFFKTRKSGDFVSRLNDSFKIQNFIDQVVGSMVVDSLVILASLGLLWYYSLAIGMITSLIIPLYIVVMLYANKKLLNLQKQVMIGYSNTESTYINLISGISTVKLFGKEDSFRQTSEKTIAEYQNTDFELRKTAATVNFKWGIINALFLLIIMLVAGNAVLHETMKLGAFIAIIGVFAYFLPSISRLAIIIIPFNESKVAFDRMLEYTTMKKEESKGQPFQTFESLKMDHLHYRYTGKPILLEDVSIQVAKNEITALVGESGCGKSTLVSLLQRIYDYEKGVILVNDQPFESFDLASWRNSLGIISQQPDFFSGTVMDNIILDTYDADQVRRVISFMKATGMDQYIQKMDHGYDTLVGENGVNISGGQRQFISFARVLYKKPKILILDEATSAMDKKTEKFFLQMLATLKHEIPILYITHRLDTLKNFADTIYVMEHGRIVANGQHQAILNSSIPNLYSEHHLAC